MRSNLKTIIMLTEYFLEYMDGCQQLGLDKDTVINSMLRRYNLNRSDLELIWEMGITE
jgi:hypothetical protein